jgi:hypothetical protein
MEPLPISLLLIAVALVAGTVAIHTLGSFFLLLSFRRYWASANDRAVYARLTASLTLVVLALLVLHLMEVALWASYFHQKDCFPDLRTAVYFSLITYSTVGYGDIVLSERYRLLGGIEALTGVLMLSWSTAMLIASVQRVYSQFMERWDPKSGAES